MGYLKDTLKGISWMTGLQILIKAVAVGKIAILARLLSPSQFGSYGVALLVLGLLEVLTETGINVFLIQEKDNAEQYLDSAWVVSIIRGFLIALIIILAAPFISTFFNTTNTNNLLYLVAGVAFVRGFINPMVVFFQKKLEFIKVFLFQGGLYLVDAGVAVTLGMLTHSESAMIIGMLSAAVLEVIVSFLIFKLRPKIKFDKDKFTKVVSSGKWVTGAGIFSYIFQNIDNAVVGRFLGTTSLGFYQQAYSVSTLPVSGVADIFNKVMFPVFVEMSSEIQQLKKAFYKSLGTIFVLAVIFGFVVFTFSHEIILIFLGDKWLIIEPVLKILAVFGVFKSILNSSYSLFLSLKMQKAIMLSEFMGIIGMGIAIYPMVSKFGIVGAGYSTIIAVICSFPVVIYNIQKIFHNEKV